MTNPGKVAHIVAAIGGSGTGKTPWIKQQINAIKPARLLVWDPQGDLAPLGQVFTDLSKLVRHTATHAKFAAVFQPGRQFSKYPDLFAILCELAYELGDLVLYVDELADVTKPSWAPDAWSVITRKGSHRRLRVFAASQRPASVDKTFLGNCTLIHCGRLNDDNDVRTMARVLRVPYEDVAGLKADDSKGLFEWIERDLKRQETRRGKLKF